MTRKLALNGFLGSPSDWSLWKELSPCEIIVAPDLWTWAKNFNAWVKKNIKPPRTLVGYSMGGRLALHALLDEPWLWTRALLISTHPGLKDEEARLQRIQADAIWAERFRKEPWKKLMTEWENQPIFHSATIRPQRKEQDYCRETLAQYLENFSLGKQENLIPKLKMLKVPLTWVTGGNDLIYETLAKEALNEHSAHFSISEGSHRLHFEFPERIRKFVLQRYFSLNA